MDATTMAAEQIETLISETIKRIESDSFDARVESLEAEGWANPVLQAQNENQGYDNQIVTGTFADALQTLIQHDETPAGCNDFDADDWEPDAEGIEAAKREHLIEQFSSGNPSVIGSGEPLVYLGTSGYFTLIREGATREEIEQAVASCYPDAQESEDAE